MDPNFITRSDWADIGDFLLGLLFVPGLMIAFAFSMLIAHALIPSLVASGHIPQDYNKLRPVFYIIAFAALLGVISYVVFVALNADNSFGEVWSRWWV
ncbi:MAG: hypothetical protein V3U26_02340 [Dehalococcoidia bacterium]